MTARTHGTLWPACSLCEGTGRYFDDDGVSACPACICSSCLLPTQARYDICNACWTKLHVLAKAVDRMLGVGT